MKPPGFDPGEAQACYTSGLALQAEGDVAGARASYERAVALDPRHARAQNNLGCILHLQGDRAAALLCYGRSLDSCADLLDAHRNLAIAWMEAADWTKAERHARRAVELERGSAELRVLHADILREAGRLDEALSACREATRLDAHSARVAEAHLNLGLALQGRGDPDEALACYRRALECNPQLAEAHVCLGALLELASDSPEAIEHYRAAIALKPDLAQARFNHALQLLHREDFARGWEEYEWRWRLPELAQVLPNFSSPPWEGSPVAGKTILLYTEQGFGDAIQFARYAPILAQAGAKMVVHCPRSLNRLFSSVSGVAAVLSDPDPVPACDFSCPLMSLPRLLRDTHPAIPVQVPYLNPDDASLERFRQLMRQEVALLRVGLVWSSHSAKPSLAALKSFSLQVLAPLATQAGVRFYSLQTGPSAEQMDIAPPGVALVDLRRELRDFSDTAAAIANLDLVISVDTAVAHLAGAMAKPVWTLVPFPPDWRWRREGDRCAWYPTMRLFRQKRSYEWDGVIREVAQALCAHERRQNRR